MLAILGEGSLQAINGNVCNPGIPLVGVAGIANTGTAGRDCHFWQDSCYYAPIKVWYLMAGY